MVFLHQINDNDHNELAEVFDQGRPSSVGAFDQPHDEHAHFSTDMQKIQMIQRTLQCR